MKSIFFAIALCLCSVLAFSKPVSNGAGEIPPFKMMLTNGKMYNATQLPKDKGILLIYFAPDCDHCHTLLKDVFKNINAFKKTQIVLVTFKPVNEVVAFEKSYNTAKYPNMVVGTEGTTFFLRYYYKMEKTPFTALYNKEGKLVSSYRNETIINDLLAKVKTLK